MKNMKKVLAVTAAVAMTATMMPTAVFADDAETFKIGVIGPMTGDNAQYGLGVYHAAQVAAEEINANGGFNGYNVEILDAGDDQADPEKAVNAYNDLLDKGMQMLCGTVTSGSCIAVGAEAAESTFMFTPSATAVDSITAGSNEFRMCFTDPAQGTKSAQYIGEHSLATKVAVLYDSSADYNSGINDAFVAAAEENGLEIVADEAYTADSNTDFSVQLSKAQGADADLVFLPIYYNEASLILAQAKAMGYAPKFFGCDGLDGILGVENFDASLAEGVMLLTPFAADAQDDATKNFVSAYEAAYGDTPNQFAADAYDAVYVVKEAIEKSGATPADGVSGICDKLKGVMTEITYDGLTGSAMSWAADGTVNKAPKAMEIKNGEYSLIQ